MSRASMPEVSRHGNEQIFDRNDARDEMLLDHVSYQRLNRRPVGLDAVGPGIAAEHVVDLLDLGLQPGQHRGKRAGVAQTCQSAALRFDEGLVQTRRKPAVALIKLAAD